MTMLDHTDEEQIVPISYHLLHSYTLKKSGCTECRYDYLAGINAFKVMFSLLHSKQPTHHKIMAALMLPLPNRLLLTF